MTGGFEVALVPSVNTRWNGMCLKFSAAGCVVQNGQTAAQIADERAAVPYQNSVVKPTYADWQEIKHIMDSDAEARATAERLLGAQTPSPRRVAATASTSVISQGIDMGEIGIGLEKSTGI